MNDTNLLHQGGAQSEDAIRGNQRQSEAINGTHLEHLAVQEGREAIRGNQRQSEAMNGTRLEHLAVQEGREARAEGDDRSRRLALVTVRRVVSILEGACHASPFLLGLIIALPLVLRVAERTERGGIHSAIQSATEPRCEQVLQREHPKHDRLVLITCGEVEWGVVVSTLACEGHDRLVLITRVLWYSKVVTAALRVEREPMIPMEQWNGRRGEHLHARQVAISGTSEQ